MTWKKMILYDILQIQASYRVYIVFIIIPSAYLLGYFSGYCDNSNMIPTLLGHTVLLKSNSLDNGNKIKFKLCN